MFKFKHHGQKLILSCFLFSLFFLCACNSQPVETDLLIPVDFSNVPDNLVLTSFHTDKIEIKIQAEPELLDKINRENTRYSVDLYTDLEFDPAGDSDSIEPGVYLIPVEKSRIPMDPAIKILSINPPYLSVSLEKKLTKRFQVNVPYTGKPAKGYIALDAAALPASVELTGPASVIENIRELKTKPVDITNAHENFKKELPLDLPGSSIKASPDHIIAVTIPIQQKLLEKAMENIPVQVWGSTRRVTIEPDCISIRIKGPFEIANNKKITDKIYSFIDLKGLGPGVYARHAYINIPAGLVMTDASPRVFTVKIE